jgi:transposase-like protein
MRHRRKDISNRLTFLLFRAADGAKRRASGWWLCIGFDDKIISLYARGMTTSEIQGHLEEIYGVEVSPELISTVTDGVIEEVRAWQGRPREKTYVILYLDALVVKVKQDGRIANRSIYLAVGVNQQGRKEVLGFWAAENEGAKFWLSVITELKNRGVQDVTRRPVSVTLHTARSRGAPCFASKPAR